MSKAVKYLQQMRDNPKDWRIEQIEVVVRYYGFGHIEGKGSHTKFYHEKLTDILVVPVKRPIKPIYIKLLIELIDRLEAL